MLVTLVVECTVCMAGARYSAEKVGDSEEPCPTPMLGQSKVGDTSPLKTKEEVRGLK